MAWKIERTILTPTPFGVARSGVLKDHQRIHFYLFAFNETHRTAVSCPSLFGNQAVLRVGCISVNPKFEWFSVFANPDPHVPLPKTHGSDSPRSPRPATRPPPRADRSPRIDPRGSPRLLASLHPMRGAWRKAPAPAAGLLGKRHGDEKFQGKKPEAAPTGLGKTAGTQKDRKPRPRVIGDPKMAHLGRRKGKSTRTQRGIGTQNGSRKGTSSTCGPGKRAGSLPFAVFVLFLLRGTNRCTS